MFKERGDWNSLAGTGEGRVERKKGPLGEGCGPGPSGGLAWEGKLGFPGRTEKGKKRETTQGRVAWARLLFFQEKGQGRP